MKKAFLLWIPFLIFLFSSFLLITGSDLLLFEVLTNPYLPLGSITTALGLLSAPVLVFYIVDKASFSASWKILLRTILSISLVLALFWLPLGRLLSENWSNSFTDRPKASLLFWNYTYTALVLPFSALMVFLMVLAWERTAEK